MVGTTDFLKWRKLLGCISAILVVLSIVSLSVRQLNLGLDFTGGTAVEVDYANPVNIELLRDHMSDQGYDSAEIKLFGSDLTVLVQLPPEQKDGQLREYERVNDESESEPSKIGRRVFSVLQAFAPGGDVVLKRVDEVGPQIGGELRDKGGIALLISMVIMLVYVSLRFQFKFALGAVVALFHDVLITLGLFSILQMSFDQSVMAALLAVIGYSLNDTIVVADRIRENFKRMRKATPTEIVNTSIEQTLGRTVVTSLTTLLVLVALALFGGESVFGFAIALLFGVLIGTYSSIYVATSVLMSMGISKDDFIQLKKADLIDDLP